MHLKNWKKLYNEGGITFFHETERYVNNLNIYNRTKNGTNLWDDLIESTLTWLFGKTNVEVTISTAHHASMKRARILSIESRNILNEVHGFLLNAFQRAHLTNACLVK